MTGRNGKRPAKRPAVKKKAAKKAVRQAAAVTIPSPTEVLGEIGGSLTEKQRRFAHLVAANPNATEAYVRAYGAENRETAKGEGYKLLKNPAVAELVASLRTELLAKFDVTNERIIEEYARIAFVDLGDLYGEDGKLLPVHEMPDFARRAIAGIEVEELYEGTGKERLQVGFTTKVKLVGKREALQDLAKIRKMLTERIEHDVSENLADLMAEARKRAKSG